MAIVIDDPAASALPTAFQGDPNFSGSIGAAYRRARLGVFKSSPCKVARPSSPRYSSARNPKAKPSTNTKPFSGATVSGDMLLMYVNDLQRESERRFGIIDVFRCW